MSIKLSTPRPPIPHPEPSYEVPLLLRYADGEWTLERVELDEEGVLQQVSRPKLLPYELAQQITSLVGMISAEVTRKNHLKWVDDLEQSVKKDRERAVAQLEGDLEQIRLLREKLT